MTNVDPVMEPISTKMIPCPGVGILKMVPYSAARPGTEKYMSTPPPGLVNSKILQQTKNCPYILVIVLSKFSSVQFSVIDFKFLSIQSQKVN